MMDMRLYTGCREYFHEKYIGLGMRNLYALNVNKSRKIILKQMCYIFPLRQVKTHDLSWPIMNHVPFDVAIYNYFSTF